MVATEATQRNPAEEVFPVAFDYNFRHVRREPAGRNSIDAHVISGPLACQIFRECNHSTFARVISNRVKIWGRAPKPRRRRDIYDRSSLLRRHEFAERLAAKKCSCQIRLDHLVPMFEAHLFNWRSPGCSRVVYEDIDSSELRHRRVRKLLNT